MSVNKSMFSGNWRSPPGIDRVSSPSKLGNIQYGTNVVGEQPVPRYLINSRTFRKKNDLVDLEEVQGDYKEEGDGGSILDGSECDGFFSGFLNALREKLMLKDETAVVEENETLLVKGGLPDNITLPGPPTYWNPQSIKVEKGEPHLESVDNLGKCSEYTFCPEF